MIAKLLGLGALALAASAGFLATVAFSQAPPPSRTVTITLSNGATGPSGPRGPTGPSGALECIEGFSPAILQINHPGGHVRIYTCLED